MLDGEGAHLLAQQNRTRADFSNAESRWSAFKCMSKNILSLVAAPVLTFVFFGCASANDADDAPAVEVSPVDAPIKATKAPMDCNAFAAGIGSGAIGNCTSLIPGSYYMCWQGGEPVFNRVFNGVNVCWSGSMY